MTARQLFQKVNAYNEMAELMRSNKAALHWVDGYSVHFDDFTDYTVFAKFIRKEYIKELADRILKSDAFEFDKEVAFLWTDCMGWDFHNEVTLELVSL